MRLIQHFEQDGGGQGGKRERIGKQREMISERNFKAEGDASLEEAIIPT